VGGLVIGGGDLRIAGDAAWGDLLALSGALASAAYYLTGRALRARVTLLSYVAVTNTACAAMLGVLCIASGLAFTGYSAHTWLMLLLLGLVPQAIGYSSVNWALGYVSATLVTVAILGEPIGSTLLAWLVLGEAPGYNVVLGGALILAGIYLAIASQGPGRTRIT
jgi:drug/metabolite transporter (DMT)-like permease